MMRMLINLEGEIRRQENTMFSVEAVSSALRANAAFPSAITMNLVRENTSDFALQ